MRRAVYNIGQIVVHEPLELSANSMRPAAADELGKAGAGVLSVIVAGRNLTAPSPAAALISRHQGEQHIGIHVLPPGDWQYRRARRMGLRYLEPFDDCVIEL